MDDQIAEEKGIKTRFKELLRGVQSSRELADKIAKEPESMQAPLMERYEKWRKGEMSPLPDIPGQLHIAKIIVWLVFLSPVIALSLDMLRALAGQMRESKSFLADPGHRRIRLYDTLVTCTGAAVVLYIMFIANPVDFTSLSNGHVFFVLLLPQLTGWDSFFFVYTTSILLHAYAEKRDLIIRRINEHYKVW